MTPGFLANVDHRPWPLPERGWVMRMRWDDLAFMHFRVDAEVLRAQLPDGVELDTWEDCAWLGVVPFRMEDVAARGLPAVPGTSRFLELNLRTYVRVNGRPGVWFFSLDASSWLAVRGARLGFNLPYYDAAMRFRDDGEVRYGSRRRHPGVTPGVFEARYAAEGEAYRAEAGSLEEWFTERYCLFTRDREGRILCGHIHHDPWPLWKCRATVERNTLGDLIGVSLGTNPDHLLLSKSISVVAWWPEVA